MDVLKIAAFSDGTTGGNPAGVVIADELPDAATMQSIAAEVGFSETVFAEKQGKSWKTRYYSPENEVPFCGHATIALGAALGALHGEGVFDLALAEADITVEAMKHDGVWMAALQSPPTKTDAIKVDQIAAALSLFDLQPSDIDVRFPPALAHAGANHYIIALNDRDRLAAMDYDLDAGRDLMLKENLITIALVHCEDDTHFNVRNAFASGGVLEDPATGAAAAAFGGYLRDLGWKHDGAVTIKQGEDMGMPSQIRVEIGEKKGSSIRVVGKTHMMEA